MPSISATSGKPAKRKRLVIEMYPAFFYMLKWLALKNRISVTGLITVWASETFDQELPKGIDKQKATKAMHDADTWSYVPFDPPLMTWAEFKNTDFD